MKDDNNSWSNADNASYYEAIPIETLKGYAVKGGFEDGCDIDIFYGRIKNAKSILEVGAGYGRVLKNLISRKHNGELFAIERSQNLCRYLTDTFSDKATIIQSDINCFDPDQKFEVILWLWSNISEFPKNEHVQILKKLAGWLTDDGVFILDSISHTTKLADDFFMKDQSYVNKTDFGTAYGYIPSTAEIDSYAHTLKFSNIEHIDYQTDTNRPRTIHVLKK